VDGYSKTMGIAKVTTPILLSNATKQKMMPREQII
jgi:hypothetical protein